MDPACLAHRLTASERAQWDRDGYLIVENALNQADIAALMAAADRVYAEQVAAGHPAGSKLWLHSFIPRDPLFIDLLDHPHVLPKVWGLLGWNISIYHAHLIVTPENGESRKAGLLGWHQDGGRMNVEIASDPPPGLQLKVAYFLSDQSRPDHGNLMVLPGSHRRRWAEMPPPDPATGSPPGAVQVCVPAGAAVLFDRRLWHAGGPNRHDHVRKGLFYGYAFRWLRNKDPLNGHEALFDRVDPIRRQLLGYASHPDGYYTPVNPRDTALRDWLLAHCPEDCIEPVNRTAEIYQSAFAPSIETV